MHTCEFKSFTLRVPKLPCLSWHNQLVKRMMIEVARPPSVVEGSIVFEWVLNEDSKKMMSKATNDANAQGLLPKLSPERVVDAVRSKIYHSFNYKISVL